jgi:hypothetical protein
VEQPIPNGVGLEAIDGRCGVVAGAAEHVVPLQELVEHDAVDEAAEADAEQEAAGVEATLLTLDGPFESIPLSL